MSVGDNEMIFRSAAHQIRRAIRKGNIHKGLEEVAPLYAELFLAMAEEANACGDSMETAKEMLREVLDDPDDDNEEQDQ